MNFAGGANPPRSAWKLQPQGNPAQRERAFQYLEGLVAYMKSFPGVRFVTASEASALYPDKAQGRAFDAQELSQIARQVNANIAFQARQAYALSASEVFALLGRFVADFVNQRQRGPLKLNGTPYGPSSPAFGVPAQQESTGISWSQFSRTALDVNAFVEATGAVPNTIWFDSQAVSPESYLLALANVTHILVEKGRPAELVTVSPAKLAAAQYVARDLPSTWDWIIFPPGFHSAHLLELARLQAWTLKPAVLEGIH